MAARLEVCRERERERERERGGEGGIDAWGKGRRVNKGQQCTKGKEIDRCGWCMAVGGGLSEATCRRVKRGKQRKML